MDRTLTKKKYSIKMKNVGQKEGGKTKYHMKDLLFKKRECYLYL